MICLSSIVSPRVGSVVLTSGAASVTSTVVLSAPRLQTEGEGLCRRYLNGDRLNLAFEPGRGHG